MKRIFIILKNVFRIFFSKKLIDCKTINDIALHTISKNNLNEFSFLEIGVFKGDNAKQIIDVIKKRYSIKIKYTGFDLFDDIEYLAQKYPEDFKQYNLEDYPYWEFRSGGHNYDSVIKKLHSSIDNNNILLVKGDTTQTIAAYFNKNKFLHVDLVYIDGCHDYDVVKSDWNNCKTLFVKNPNLIIAFDDYTYEGVKAVYEEIIKEYIYNIININTNQFVVMLSESYKN